MPLTAKRLIKLLKKNGFVEKSQCGSHRKMYNKELKITVTVPVHSRDLSIGMERAILKQAHIKRGDK